MSGQGRLAGKVALITGAARGQGEAAARLFAGEGAGVVIADVLDAEGKTLADELGGQARYVHLDVTDEDGWVAAVADTEREFGRLDVLVNNAGILTFSPLEDLTLEGLRRVLDVNLIGTFLGLKTAPAALRRAGGGSIVNISSVEGIRGSAGLGAYTASKFGVTGLTKVAAMELGPDIRVNSVHPGGIDTRMIRDHGVDEKALAYIAKKVALKRVGLPDDVARLVLFLASDESSYCTGAEFVIDGGATAHAGY
jgi:3alpha(or 20beta)-hydroxysteroid dehydrogenase